MESVPGAVATGSQLLQESSLIGCYPVATAPGTDLILKLRHYQMIRRCEYNSAQFIASRLALHTATNQHQVAEDNHRFRLSRNSDDRIDRRSSPLTDPPGPSSQL